MRAFHIAAVAGLSLVVVACASSSSDHGTIAQAGPPPAPPPPPPPMAAMSQRGVAANAPVASIESELKVDAGQSRYAYVPPIQVPTDPGNERYAGEEVSPVHVTQAEPVSTFAVDVDTGAYANVRRFLTLGNLPP